MQNYLNSPSDDSKFLAISSKNNLHDVPFGLYQGKAEQDLHRNIQTHLLDHEKNLIPNVNRILSDFWNNNHQIKNITNKFNENNLKIYTNINKNSVFHQNFSTKQVSSVLFSTLSHVTVIKPASGAADPHQGLQFIATEGNQRYSEIQKDNNLKSASFITQEDISRTHQNNSQTDATAHFSTNDLKSHKQLQRVDLTSLQPQLRSLSLDTTTDNYQDSWIFSDSSGSSVWGGSLAGLTDAPPQFITGKNINRVANSCADDYRDHIANLLGNIVLGRDLSADEKTKSWQSVHDAVYDAIDHNKHHGRDSVQNVTNRAYMQKILDLRWDMAHSGDARDSISNMINGVQGRNNASDQLDHDYIQQMMDRLGKGDTSLAKARSDLIDSTGYVAADNMFTTFYGHCTDDERNWFNGELKSGKTAQQIWGEEAHSDRMTHAIFDMINGVQDRNNASDATDAAYKNAAMDALGRKEISFAEMRNSLINSDGQTTVINAYEQQLFGIDADQNTQNWVRGNLLSGRTMQDLRWEDAHADRMKNAIFNMINDVQDRTDASDQFDHNYIQNTMDALGHDQTTQTNVRNQLIDSPGQDRVISRQTQRIAECDANQPHKNWVRSELHKGRSMRDIGQELSRGWLGQASVEDVYKKLTWQEPQTQAQWNFYKERLAEGCSKQDIKYALAHAWEGKKIIQDLGKAAFDRDLNDNEISSYQGKLGTSDAQTVLNEMAHSDEVSIAITNRLRNEKYFEIPSKNLIDQIVVLQDDIANRQITLDRIQNLIDKEAKLTSIDENTDKGKYTPVHTHKAGSYKYTDGAGHQFMVTNEYSFQDIIADAKAANAAVNKFYGLPEDSTSFQIPLNPLVEAEFINRMNAAIGQEGKFDAQRDIQQHMSYDENVDNANYNVGIWCAAAGVTNEAMKVKGLIFTLFKSKSGDSKRNLSLWQSGYDDYLSGKFNH